MVHHSPPAGPLFVSNFTTFPCPVKHVGKMHAYKQAAIRATAETSYLPRHHIYPNNCPMGQHCSRHGCNMPIKHVSKTYISNTTSLLSNTCPNIAVHLDADCFFCQNWMGHFSSGILSTQKNQWKNLEICIYLLTHTHPPDQLAQPKMSHKEIIHSLSSNISTIFQSWKAACLSVLTVSKCTTHSLIYSLV